MNAERTVKRSKSLSIEPIDDATVRFVLGLEDKGHTEDGDEIIHSLEIYGVLSLATLEILEIEPKVIHHPYPECADSLPPIRAMVGARIGPGFRVRVIELMGRTLGCTHFMTLMLDLAAAHTLTTFLRMRARAPFTSRSLPGSDWMRVGLALEPRLENACIALRTESPVIQAVREPKNSSESKSKDQP